MGEYIEREAAICIANYAVDESPYDKNPMKPETLSEYSRGWNAACDYIRDKLETAPDADAAPVVHGRWEEADWVELDDSGAKCIFIFKAAMRCSICRLAFRKELLWRDKYCPNCGARMDGDT